MSYEILVDWLHLLSQTGKNQLLMTFRKVRAGEENIESNAPELVDNALTPDQEAENAQLADVIGRGLFRNDTDA